jgi:hypothetical protein
LSGLGSGNRQGVQEREEFHPAQWNAGKDDALLLLFFLSSLSVVLLLCFFLFLSLSHIYIYVV